MGRGRQAVAVLLVLYLSGAAWVLSPARRRPRAAARARSPTSARAERPPVGAVRSDVAPAEEPRPGGPAGARGAERADPGGPAAAAPAPAALPTRVRGRVTDPGGLALREFSVNGHAFHFDGCFELELPPGDATLVVAAPGFVRRELPLGAARPQDLLVPLQPARRVPVWVTGADTGMALCPWLLEARGPGFHLRRVVEDPGGMTTIDAPLDPLAIRVRADGYVGWEGEDALAGRVVLERGVAVSGQVTDGDLVPLPTSQAAVVAIGARHAWAPQVVEPDPDGSFLVRGIAPDEAFALFTIVPRQRRSSPLRVRWLQPGTDRVLIPAYPLGRIVLEGGPPRGPVTFECSSAPEAVRPAPKALEQEGNPTWIARELPCGTWVVRWEGRAVGTVELEPDGDRAAETRALWPGDPEQVRLAWSAWRDEQRPLLADPAPLASVAPLRSADPAPITSPLPTPR